MAIYKLLNLTPKLPNDYWVAESAQVIGNVVLGNEVGVWFGSVLRGDNEPIEVGKKTNIQENCILHVDDNAPIIIGDGCTIGHQVILHGCSIDSNSLVGMGSIILNHAKIGKNCLVGAGSLVTEGKEFPDKSLILGSPAKAVRELNKDEIKFIKWSSDHYVKNYKNFAKNLKKIN
mgnify:CR=1 FL=1|tara:strand:+ start:760 stop:1284 length:525 start_codon:yes stop_codon:yes gene_type:complete